MTKQTHLLDRFINALHRKIKKRSELVNFISETLKIEKDSASRRLNKKVYFSIEEMEVLSIKLGISIDGLLRREKCYPLSPPYVLYPPMSVDSVSQLFKKMERDLMLLDEVASETAEFGSVFTFPPMEFLIPFKNLTKFVFFKWGYYFVGTDEFNNYSTWSLPPLASDANRTLMEVYNKWNSVFYIWDISTIWSLVKDVIYLTSIFALEPKDTEAIKNEMHEMLYNLEKMASGTKNYLSESKKIDLYVSSLHLGSNFSYFISENKWYNTFNTFFASSSLYDDYETCMQVKEWMYSLKKVCTLISESGAKERKLFFNEQHQIVETITV